MDIVNIIIDERWENFEEIVSPYLYNLDPSLFQNIILGILAIFIPFAIVFYTNILDSKEKRSVFEKMVLSDEVLGTRNIFWFSVVTILFFSFFTGKDISFELKIMAIVYLLGALLFLWRPFMKLLIFSEGKKTEFAISFLKKLKFSKILFIQNDDKSEKMTRAWNSFWSEKTGFNERDFTEIFISHIDDNLNAGKLNNAIQIARAYNLQQQEGFLISYEILPKIFEWNEKLWEKEQIWMEKYTLHEKIKKFIPEKHFPTFQRLMSSALNKAYKIEGSFWNWNYFEQKFFKEALIKLLKENPYQFFAQFEKYINQCEDKLEQIETKKEKQKYGHYITGIFRIFCVNFFDNINKSNSKFSIWEHDFPDKWKIKKSNFENNASRTIFNEFLLWSQDKIFKGDDDKFDNDLTEVVNGLFPNVHPTYFPDFLILFDSFSLKDALDKNLNFYVMGSSITWSGEKSDDEKNEMFRQNELSRQEETVDIILEFFSNWRHISLFKEDLTEDENEKWKEYSKEKRKEIINRVRIKKLTDFKKELESKEIKEYCKRDKTKESRRVEFLELLKLLIEKISKK